MREAPGLSSAAMDRIRREAQPRRREGRLDGRDAIHIQVHIRMGAGISSRTYVHRSVRALACVRASR